MKNTSNILTLITLAFLISTLNIKAQVVDESIIGIQTGYLGVWWNYEARINKNWAIRSEVGYEAPLFATTVYLQQLKVSSKNLISIKISHRSFYL